LNTVTCGQAGGIVCGQKNGGWVGQLNTVTCGQAGGIVCGQKNGALVGQNNCVGGSPG